MQIAQRRLRFCHLERCDAQRPQIRSIVVRGLWILVARNYLRRHPVRRTDERIPSTNRAVQLRRHPEIDQLHFGIVRQQHVLPFDVAMDDFVGVQIAEAAQNLAANVRDPFLLEALALCRFDQIGDAAGATVFHHQPQLVVFAGRRFLDERPIVGGNVAMVAVLFQHVDFQLDFLLLVFGDVHHLDGGQLAGFCVATLCGMDSNRLVDYCEHDDDDAAYYVRYAVIYASGAIRRSVEVNELEEFPA